MAHIQIPDQTPRHDYTVGATPQDRFEVRFPFFDVTDLKVFVDGSPLVFRSDPRLPFEFTVEGIRAEGGYSGGVVRLGIARTSAAVVIVREMPIARQTDFAYPSEALNIRALNTELDRIAAQFQDARLRSLRSIRLRDDDPTSSLLMPTREQRRGRLLGFGADEAALPQTFNPSDLLGGLTLPVPIALGGTGSITAADARVALGIGSVPLITADEIGLVAGYPADDTKRLNDAMEAQSAVGGGVFYLRSKTGNPFYFNSIVRVPSSCQLLFASPVQLGDRGGLRINGATARSGPTCYLAANAIAAGTFVSIDRAASGIAGPLSSAFATGDLISIIGLRDHAGEARQSQTLRITSVNDGSSRLNVTPDLAFDYQATYSADAYEAAFGEANRTTVRKIVSAPLALNNVPKTDVVQLEPGHIVKFSVGDFVAVEDEKTAGNVAGTSTNRIHFESAQIVGLNLAGADTVTLSRRLLHAFDVGYAARMIKVEPAANASIVGAVVEFVAAPAADVVTHTFEISYGLDSTIDDCSVPNEGAFGSRGNAFRVSRSFACGVNRPILRNPAYLGSGEGYGVAMYYATDCWCDDPWVGGSRHPVIFQGSTACVVSGVQAIDVRLSAVDFHGCEEVGCVVEAEILECGTRTASSTRTAVRFGNGTHFAGSYDCVVHARRITGFSGVNGYAVDFVPPSSGCVFSADRVDDVWSLAWMGDVAGFPGLIASNNAIENTVVENCGGLAIDANGGRSDASARAHAAFRMHNVQVRRSSQHIQLRRMTGVEFERVTIEASGPHGTAQWGLDAQEVTGLRVYDSRIRGTRKGIRLRLSPAARFHRLLVEDLSGSTVLFTDAGGNDGYVLGLLDWIGFAATREIQNGGSVGAEYPTVGGTYVYSS